MNTFKGKWKYLVNLIFLAAIPILLISFSGGEKKDYPQDFPQNYKIVTPPIPSKIDFCGEKVPLNNIDVRERLEREIIVDTYRHSSTILYIKRANRWFPVIEPILKKNKIPDDMKYLAVAESGLENVISPAGAIGFWQFISSAAKRYDLEISGEVDERYNVVKATEAACKYLQESYDKYGSWTLAAASYNMGTNGVTNQLERQKTNNYYSLLLNVETSRYIFRILSLKNVLANPELYGFSIPDDELYPKYETITVKIKSEVKHFADFAAEYGINYRVLKLFNPWLRENYLTNKKKREYVITLPTKETMELFAFED